MTTYSGRMVVMASLCILTGIIFLLRLFYIQVMDDQYKIYANDNVLRRVTMYPARGLLYDRKRELLVYNEPAYDLMVVPRQVRDMDTTAFCRLIGMGEDEFTVRLKAARKYSAFRESAFEKQISARQSDLIREKLYRFPGFYLQLRTLRSYPSPTAAHALGYVGEVSRRMITKDTYYKSGDYIGISGIERSYETELRGRKGVKVLMVDVHNRVVGSFDNGAQDTLSVPGHDIVTTIDAALQAYGERLMAGKTGSVVAIEPATGEILALISAPSYDPNLLVGRERAVNYAALKNDTLKPLYNRAILADLYPPGSTFKLVNALIGMQEGVLDSTTTYSCQGGYHSGGLTVGCHAHPSPLPLRQSIQHSCNAYYCRAFRAIIDKYPAAEQGFNVWRSHVLSLGLGKTFGSDLSDEKGGLVPAAAYYDRYYGRGRWKSLTIISLAIGQGELGVTPLQMANLAAVIANRGYYYTPHVAKEIEGRKSGVREWEKHTTTVAPMHFEFVAGAMEKVVEAGTARIARIKDISVCGKTGTAQNPHGKDHSVFMAFAPKDEPKIAIAVYVENAGFGSTWAAPIASLMMEKYLTDTVARPALEQRIMEADLITP